MRAPHALPRIARMMRLAPANFERDLSHAGAAVALVGGEAGLRYHDGQMHDAWSFDGGVTVKKLHVAAVATVHEDVEWRGIDAWSPVYAFRAGVLVAVVQPMMPKAIGVS